MLIRVRASWFGITALLLAELSPRSAVAQVPAGPARVPGAAVVSTTSSPVTQRHPLVPVIEAARSSLAQLQGVKDYSCTFAKRERIDGQLSDFESMYIKVRHEPFSVYLYCLGPEKPKGQEVLYITGRNDGMVLAHATGIRDKLFGTLTLDPLGSYMMEGNRYPITSIGMKNLLEKTIPIYEEESRYGECDVRVLDDAKVDDRPCVCMQVTHPTLRREFRAHLMRMFYDKELNLPIRWEAYYWPATPGGPPQLVEEYTYRKLSVNPGLSDIDFDTKNPGYGF